MTAWNYKIITIKGGFKSRSRKRAEIQAACDELGKDGWELVSVSFDWFFSEYDLFFKKRDIAS